MKAVALTRYLPVSDPDAFLDVELPKPSPMGRDILVAVKAISINPVDVKVRAPKDKVESAPRVIGYDAAGVVEAVVPSVVSNLLVVVVEVLLAAPFARVAFVVDVVVVVVK